MFLLSTSLYALIYLLLHACSNSMPISRVQRSAKAHTNQNKQGWHAAEKADQTARCANRNITGIEARFQSKTYKLPFYYDQ